MQKTYLFYDLETSGLNKSFDQVMQFAAIRTDLELNPIEEFNLLVKLNPDVIPSPYAILTHHITIQDMLTGMSEYDAIKQIHAIINQPGTISLGYNTLGFDDEFLRFSFYRNLLPPYTHQYANNCTRMDLFPMAVMYFLFKQDVLTWPLRDGESTLKLEYLSEVNHLATGPAHDAMVDVRATVALAKRFMQAKEMWDYLVGYFNKEIDQSRMMQLPVAFSVLNESFRQAIYLEGSLGAKNKYQTPVISLGTHQHYKNQTLWLRLDTENIAEQPWVIRKKLGEPGFLLPTNDRFMQYLSEERLQLMNENLQWLQTHEKQFQEMVEYHRHYTYPEVPDADIDSALYINGFLTDEERFLCERFHQAAISEKINLLDRFTNRKLREQALRLLGRNYLDELPNFHREEFLKYLKLSRNDASFDFKGNQKLTLQQALADIQQLRSERKNLDDLILLNELENYINNIGGGL